jgi:UDPglucose--hexose-1-phosphate uridylyltransferase
MLTASHAAANVIDLKQRQSERGIPISGGMKRSLKINFESIQSHFTILNPSRDFAEEVHNVEIRKDPLLGDTSVYNPFLRDKAKLFFSECDPEVVGKLVEESEKSCFLCGDGVMKNTPIYPLDLLDDGRIRSGEAVLFPNLFSIAQYHAVVSLSKAHFLKLAEFTPELLGDGLAAARRFLNAVYAYDSSVPFAATCCNYLFPAGASLVHPHMQILVTPAAYSYHGRLLDACRNYYRERGSEYHADLIAEEKALGERYIAQRGRWHWLAAFSPTGNNEIIAVHQEESDFGCLVEEDISSLAYGISRVLAFYESLGYLSFNYALFSVKKSHGDGIRCLLKIINRQNLYTNYRNDDYFLQKLLQSELIITPPEELASQISVFFER